MQAKGPRRASWPSPKTYENSSVRLGGAGEAELLQIQRVRGIHELGGRYRDTGAAENQCRTVPKRRICSVNKLYRADLNGPRRRCD